MTPGHRVLVVEDEPAARELVCVVLRSLGFVVAAVETVEEGLAAIESEGFCLYVFDQQLPFSRADVKPLVAGGEGLIAAVRAKDARHNGKGHVTPIVALTGYSRDFAFVSKLFKEGCDAFVPKPVSDHMELLTRETRDVLGRAGREEHARCAGLAHVGESAREEAGSQGGDGALAVTQGMRSAHPLFGKIAAAVGAKAWGEMEMGSVDGHTIRVRGEKSALRLSFLDIGFGGADCNPIDKWRVVDGTLTGGGIFRGNRAGAYESARNTVSVAQNILKAAFGLADNPFDRHKRGLGWKAKFVVKSCRDEEDL